MHDSEENIVTLLENSQWNAKNPRPKLCPKCQEEPTECNIDHNFFWVECRWCGFRSHTKKSRRDAQRNWDRSI